MDRKEMIRLLESKSGEKAKYMGAPGFDYQIKIKEGTYTISKDCVIRDASNKEVDFESLLQMSVEAVPENNIKSEEKNTLEIAIPIQGHTYVGLRNIANMIYSKQVHLKKALDLNDDILTLGFVEAINDEEVKSIEHFKEAVKRAGMENCKGIEFDFINNNIILKFGISIEDTEKVEAVIKLAALLNKSAKEQKYASFKPSADDNIKFTLRTWLIRLGFVGEEYKKARKTLLKNLEGNGAFRKPKETKEVMEV